MSRLMLVMLMLAVVFRLLSFGNDFGQDFKGDVCCVGI